MVITIASLFSRTRTSTKTAGPRTLFTTAPLFSSTPSRRPFSSLPLRTDSGSSSRSVFNPGGFRRNISSSPSFLQNQSRPQPQSHPISRRKSELRPKPEWTPRGSLLYVPASSPKFLKSSLNSLSPSSSSSSSSSSKSSRTIITYDLEDSVHDSSKREARERLVEFLNSSELKNATVNASASVSAGGGDGDGPNGRDTNRLRSPIAVRPNSPFTTVDSEDLFIDSEISSSSSSPDGEGGGTQEDDVRMRKEEENEETVRNWGWDDIRAIWGNNKNVNSTSTGVNVRGKEEEDQDGRRSALPMMVLPKVDHPSMMTEIDEMLVSWRGGDKGKEMSPHHKIPLIASIESPEALSNLHSIASWRGLSLNLVGLLFAAEDFCASSRILRSPSRTELLFTRSAIVMAARTNGLAAIDMVCVDYKDLEVLKEECEEGRRLGFDAKQAIHPSQVEVITRAFAPSEKEILRATRILSAMRSSSRGAEGIRTEDGKEEMIDKPMILQARRIIKEAREAGLIIPGAA